MCSLEWGSKVKDVSSQVKSSSSCSRKDRTFSQWSEGHSQRSHQKHPPGKKKELGCRASVPKSSRNLRGSDNADVFRHMRQRVCSLETVRITCFQPETALAASAWTCDSAGSRSQGPDSHEIRAGRDSRCDEMGYLWHAPSFYELLIFNRSIQYQQNYNKKKYNTLYTAHPTSSSDAQADATVCNGFVYSRQTSYCCITPKAKQRHVNHVTVCVCVCAHASVTRSQSVV